MLELIVFLLAAVFVLLLVVASLLVGTRRLLASLPDPDRGASALPAPPRPSAAKSPAPSEKPGLHRARPRDIRDAERIHELLALDLEVSGLSSPPSHLGGG